MSPAKLMRSLVRRWPWPVVMALLGLGLAALAIHLSTARYSAHAEVLISPASSRSGDAVAERTLKSYARVLGGRITAGSVVQDLALADGTSALDRRLSAEVVADTAILRVTAVSIEAARSADIARSAAEAFVQWVMDLQTGGSATALTATITEQPAAPVSPSSPPRAWWLTIGGVAGLLVGLLVAAWRELTDHTIRTPAELEEDTGAPVLGAIAYDRAAVSTPLITSLGTHHPRFEAMRILCTNLRFLDVDRDNVVVTITSSAPGEGKSTTAANLAIALAQAGSRVVLVEGDLRRPRLSEYLTVEKSVGLTTVLVGRVTLDAALQQAATPGMDVLTSGALPPNPAEILQTDAMAAVVAELRRRFDVVLIDAPPLLPVTDAALLASISDGAILVVRHGETGRDEVRAAAKRLSSVGARLLGTVLTMTPPKELSRYGYGYGYGYGQGYGPEYFSRTTTSDSRKVSRRA